MTLIKMYFDASLKVIERRLLDFIQILNDDIYTSEEIDALWQSIKTATIK